MPLSFIMTLVTLASEKQTRQLSVLENMLLSSPVYRAKAISITIQVLCLYVDNIPYPVII